MHRAFLTALVLLACSPAAAQTPWVAAISPASVTVGSGAFTLTVTGSGFAPLARINWNQTSLTTSVSSSSRLIATVPASLIATTGIATITVVNPDGATSASTQIVIAPPMTVLTSEALPAATRGRLYSQAIAVTGGSPPYRFALARGVLPIGVSLDGNTGAVAGLPISEGSYEFTIQVADAAQALLHRTFTLGVFRELAIVTNALPRAIAGVPYMVALLAAGGSMPYANWQVASGSLPSGISLSTAGMLSGAATAAGPFQFTVRLRDYAGLTATRVLTLEVSAVLSMPAETALPVLTVAAPFSHRLAPVGGTVPYLFSMSDGHLPPGVRLNADDGTLSGAASAAGSWSATIQAIDAAGQRATTTLAFTAIDSLALSTEPRLPAAVAGLAYSQLVAAAGGSQPYRFALVSGLLPAAMTFDGTNGRIAGTPSEPGDFNFSITVADAAGRAVSGAFMLTVALPPAPRLTIALPASVAPATQSPVSIAIDAPYPVELSGVLELATSQLPDDPAVRFSNGSRTVAYRFPPGEIAAQFDTAPLALQSGTTSGPLSLQATLETAGRPLLALPVRHTLDVRTSAPILREARLTLIVGGFEIAVTGFSPSREMEQAVFRFAPTAGETLDTPELTVPLRTLAGQWFGSPGSAAFGSQFTYQQRFEFTGSMDAVHTVSLTLSNSIGESEVITTVR